MSGGLEDDESPLDAAKRELREELGVIADEWTSFGCVDPFTTIIRSPNHMFLATGLRSSAVAPDAGEVLESVRIPFREVERMVVKGEITHAASCVLILMAGIYLRENHRL